jgi:flavin-binding protein dodecin
MHPPPLLRRVCAYGGGRHPRRFSFASPEAALTAGRHAKRRTVGSSLPGNPVRCGTLAVRMGSREKLPQGAAMSVATVTEISSTSEQSFEDAIRQGLERATKTLRNVTSAWVKEQQVKLQNGKIARYQVNLEVTFILDE